MEFQLDPYLKKKSINGWPLFWLISAPLSIGMIVAIANADLSTGKGISSLIQLSVRCAVPLLYTAFLASSAHALFSSDLTAWILRNRKYLGLCFAVGMAWQAVFIIWMVGAYTDYYANEVFVLRDLIEGLLGYIVLLPMVLTTFKFGRRLITRKQWRLLHKTGIYYLWAYAFSVYWWEIFYYRDPVFLDYAFYWAGLLAWGLRAAAWTKARRYSIGKSSAGAPLHRLAGPLGLAVASIGVAAASFGSAWIQPSQEILYGYALTRIPEALLPYWPFEPFLPLLVIGVGCLLIGNSDDWKNRTNASRA